MRFRHTMLRLLPLTLLFSIAGCASGVTLYPITGEDIIPLEQNQTVTAPKRGFFLSDFYMEQVTKAKVR